MAILNGWQITRTGVVFVIGIIVLVALVLGGIWLVRDRGEQTRRQEAAKIAQENLESQSETSTGTNSGTVAPPETTETETQPVASTAATSNELPQTGADVSHIAILSLLVLAATYYATSRRAVQEL